MLVRRLWQPSTVHIEGCKRGLSDQHAWPTMRRRRESPEASLGAADGNFSQVCAIDDVNCYLLAKHLGPPRPQRVNGFSVSVLESGRPRLQCLLRYLGVLTDHFCIGPKAETISGVLLLVQPKPDLMLADGKHGSGRYGGTTGGTFLSGATNMEVC